MAAVENRECFGLYNARAAVTTWYLGYPIGNYYRLENGGWKLGVPDMPLKHIQFISLATQIAQYGAEVFYTLDHVERLWATPLAQEECVIEPDRICADLGLTMPLETDVSEDEWADKAEACRSVYIQWAEELWGNSTARGMVDRLRVEFASRDVVLGADITRLLDDVSARLGPGGVDAPE